MKHAITHNASKNLNHITLQLLDCVLWDHVSNKSNSPLILGFPIYGEHLYCKTWSFQQEAIYSKFLIVASFFGKRTWSRFFITLLEVTTTFPIFFGAHTNVLFTTEVKILMLIMWSCRSSHIWLLLNSEWLSYFEHATQSLLNTCVLDIRSWSHTKPHTTQIWASNWKKELNHAHLP
jgi:hypothetical protein